jgi:hypothetical protein
LAEIVGLSRRFRPAGSCRELPNDFSHAEPHAILRDRRDQARAEELNNLRLALATFALQLDAFEMSLCDAALRIGVKPGVPVPPADADSDWRLQKGDK